VESEMTVTWIHDPPSFCVIWAWIASMFPLIDVLYVDVQLRWRCILLHVCSRI
jgi:hypothetical protein